VTFDLAEFLTPLDPWVIAMAFVLGVVMGFRLRQVAPPLSGTRTFWQLADGLVFFIPLAALRAFEGSQNWERLLATLPLWIVYVAAMRLGNSFEWDRLPGNRHPRSQWPGSGERRRRQRSGGDPRRRASDRTASAL